MWLTSAMNTNLVLLAVLGALPQTIRKEKTMEITQEIRDEIRKLMEGYAKNPSNSNKYVHSMYALFEDEKVYSEQ